MTSVSFEWDFEFHSSGESPLWIPLGPATRVFVRKQGWIQAWNLQDKPLVASSSGCAAVDVLTSERSMPRKVSLPKDLKSECSSHICGHDEILTSSSSLPVASEDTWEQRTIKRIAAIHHIKMSEFYQRHQYVDLIEARPQTPNALDRSVSKREWEAQVGNWRSKWREIDGVAYLSEQGYNEQASKDAWNEAEQHIKELRKSERRHPGSDQLFQKKMHEQCKREAIKMLSVGASM